jgi:hypothetical protein
MGCKNTKEDGSKGINIDEEWRFRGLPEVNRALFENDSELQLYKTINLIRHDPKWAIPHIKSLR